MTIQLYLKRAKVWMHYCDFRTKTDARVALDSLRTRFPQQQFRIVGK